MRGSLVVRVLSIICEFHLELCLLYKDLLFGVRLGGVGAFLFELGWSFFSVWVALHV